MNYLSIGLISLSYLVSAAAFSSQLSEKEWRDSFNPLMERAEKVWMKAARVKFEVLPQGSRLSDMECEVLREKLKSNYPINPFSFAFEGGIFQNPVCANVRNFADSFIELSYLLVKSGKTDLGLPYSFVIQTMYPNWRGLVQYYLDSTYKIVKVQHSLPAIGWADPQGQNTEQYELDSDGTIYFHQVGAEISKQATKSEGVLERFAVQPGDGSAPLGLTKTTFHTS